MARVFIVGAGYVGSATADLLAREGHTVDVGRRSATGQARSHAMDAQRPDTHPPALREAEVVVYCVGSDAFTPEAYRAAYVDGLRGVLATAQSARRLLYVSSTSVYTQDDGCEVTESSPTRPRGFSGEQLLEGEAVAAQALAQSSVVRFSGIYGPGRDRLIRLVRSGGALSAKTRAGLTNRIHRDDCARVLAHLVSLGALAPRYNGSDCAPTPLGDIVDWLAGQLGLATPPEGDDALAMPQRGGNRRVSSALLRASGFHFRYPTYREGFGALLASES